MTPRRAAPKVLCCRVGRLGGYADAYQALAVAGLRRAAQRAGLGADHEISLVLCDNPAIRALNRVWRGKDRPTDVLSFPLHEVRPGDAPPPGPLGDIIVSLPTVRRAAAELGETPERHLERLLVHGLAHLLGHDHQTDTQARRMLRAEEAILERKLNQ